jgi:hypothetical protein
MLRDNARGRNVAEMGWRGGGRGGRTWVEVEDKMELVDEGARRGGNSKNGAVCNRNVIRIVQAAVGSNLHNPWSKITLVHPEEEHVASEESSTVGGE